MTTTTKSTKMAQDFDVKIFKNSKKQQGIATSGILLTSFEDSRKIINATESTEKINQVLENLLELEKIRS